MFDVKNIFMFHTKSPSFYEIDEYLFYLLISKFGTKLMEGNVPEYDSGVQVVLMNIKNRVFDNTVMKYSLGELNFS